MSSTYRRGLIERLLTASKTAALLRGMRGEAMIQGSLPLYAKARYRQATEPRLEVSSPANLTCFSGKRRIAEIAAALGVGRIFGISSHFESKCPLP